MTKQYSRWATMVLILVIALVTVACGGSEEPHHEKPAKITANCEETEFNCVTVTQKAHDRLGIEMGAIAQQGATMVVPYSSILYGLHGETWVYTVASTPLTYRRIPITIDNIEGDVVFLSDGPPVGTEVVTVAVAELYGADTGVGK